MASIEGSAEPRRNNLSEVERVERESSSYRLVQTSQAEPYGQASLPVQRVAHLRDAREESARTAHASVAAWFVQLVSEELQRLDSAAVGRAPEGALRPALAGLWSAADAEPTDDALSLSAKPLPLAELERVLLQATERTGDHALGLTVGASADLGLLTGSLESAHGLTVRELLGRLRRGCSVIDGVDLELVERGTRATVVCTLPSGYPAVSRFFTEFLFVTLVRAVKALHPRLHVELQRVRFAHAAPKLEARHAELLCGPVLFKQKLSALRIARSLLDLGQNTDDVELVNDSAQPTSARVRERLTSHPALDKVDCYEVAADLGLTWRALRRRLAADGTSLSALVDEARCAVACAALSRGVPIKAVAEQAGYSDHSGLFRAFRRCTGMTPAAYRRHAWTAASSR